LLIHPLLRWILDAAKRNDSDLALVHSISYGASELPVKLMGAEVSQLDPFMAKQFNVEAMKLSTRGVSIFVAAGDGGVCGGHGSWQCDYEPIFPASSPYVTTIGGTMGPESGLPEIVTSVEDGQYWTTGGGFSTLFAAPWYQKKAVSGYLQSDVGKSAKPGFNASGRAYPDLSFTSNNFEVVIGGKLFPFLSGTSAASPSVAGLFSLINARRRAMGKSSVGFVNPTLYSAGTSNCCNDIVSGSNKCMQKRNFLAWFYSLSYPPLPGKIV